MISLPYVDFGIGRRQIFYEWPEIARERVQELEAFLRQRDYDYPLWSVRIDGFRIEPMTPGWAKRVGGGLFEHRDEDGRLVRRFAFQENYWRKPLLSRGGLLAVFAVHGITRVRGYDLPLGHRCTCGCSLGMDDACDAVIADDDIFEVELPFVGEDRARGRGYDE